MAKKYRIITNIDDSSAAIRQEAAMQAVALSAMTGCGPAFENAILPDRQPSAELVAALVPDEDDADELHNVVLDFESAFGDGKD